MSEADLLRAVMEAAQLHGLLAYHTHDSRHSAEGFPDVVIVGRWLEFWELKSARGRLTPAQALWLDQLTAIGITAEVWRPDDWDTIVERMRLLSDR